MATTSDILSQLANLFPTGTFVVFQLLAPIVTNDGACGVTEQVLTGVTVAILTFACSIMAFTDSYLAENGKIYIGIVSTKGLWNPIFYRSGLADVSGATYTGGGTKYLLKKRDFVNVLLAIVAFGTLTLLSPQATECLYGGVPTNVKKAVPILVAMLVSFIFVFSPPARNGVGYAYFYVYNANTSSSDVSKLSLVSNPVATLPL